MSKFAFALVALALTLGAHTQAKAQEAESLVIESIDEDLIEQLDLVEKACVGCNEEELQQALEREYDYYMRSSAYDLMRPTRTVIASWYGGGEKLSKHTANGERFNPNAMTAAMRSCPFGTRVKVTNPKNGKSVIVRINDRGPAKWTGASIDLTRAAARKIGIAKGKVIIDKC